MNVIRYLKEKGVKRAFQVIWQYKLENILEKVVYIFTKNKPLQDKILIESHNDFDCNKTIIWSIINSNGLFSNYIIYYHS